jgi:hemerythrin
MTQLLEWTEDLSVGIQEIDEQHKVLVGLLNELDEAIHQKKGREVSGEILNRLVDYTKIHFAVEESLMRILHYPDYDDHKHHHEELLHQVLDLQEKYINGGANITMALLHFLKSWLSEHIIKSDKLYTPHFLSMGVKKTWLKESWVRRLFG